MLASSSPVMARAAAEAAAAASFYAGSGSEGNAYYALHNESGSGEFESPAKMPSLISLPLD